MMFTYILDRPDVYGLSAERKSVEARSLPAAAAQVMRRGLLPADPEHVETVVRTDGYRWRRYRCRTQHAVDAPAKVWVRQS